MNTIRQMRARFLESMDVAMRLSGSVRPKQFGNSWPEYELEFKEMKFHNRPSAIQLLRCNEFWDWFMSELGETERHMLIEYGRIRLHPMSTVRGFCEKNGLFEGKYQWQIDKIFQKLMRNCRINRTVRPFGQLDEDRFLGKKPENAPLVRTPKYHREPGAVPVDDPKHPDRKRLITKLLRHQRLRLQASSTR